MTKLGYFRDVIAINVAFVRTQRRVLLPMENVILMVILRAVEGLKRGDLRHNRLPKNLRAAKLLNVRFRNAFLLWCSVKISDRYWVPSSTSQVNVK